MVASVNELDKPSDILISFFTPFDLSVFIHDIEFLKDLAEGDLEYEANVVLAKATLLRLTEQIGRRSFTI